MLPMRKNEFLSGVSVPEVSSEEVWDIDKTLVISRVVMPDFVEHGPYDNLKGGQWLREAAYLIATDMLANKAVKVEQRMDLCTERTYLSYVAKVGTPNQWRILPC